MMQARVSVVGLGYVGLPLAILGIEKGFTVTGIDLDKAKLENIKKGKSPITDDFVKTRLKPSSLKVTSSFAGIKKADVVIICVPTPVKNDYMPDLGPLKGAAEAVAKNLRKGILVVVESTININIFFELLVHLGTIKNIVAQNHGHFITANKIGTHNVGVGEAPRFCLNFVTEFAANLLASSQ